MTDEETARQALRFLDITIPANLEFKERKLKRQADEVTEAWVQEYYQHERANNEQENVDFS